MRSRRITAMAVSTMAAVAAGTGGMLALQAPAHATETGTDGLIATWNGTKLIEEESDGSDLKSYDDPYNANPAWSSDGSRLLWEVWNSTCGLYEGAPDRTGVVKLPGGFGATCYGEEPTWFARNTEAVFTSNYDPVSYSLKNFQLFSVPILGSADPTLLFDDPAFNDTQPKAVGDLIVFTHAENKAGAVPQVWLYNKATGAAGLLIDDAQSADISPDGKTVVFTRPDSPELFTASIDGSNITQLTDTGASHQTPVWSPSGTSIAFANGTNTVVLDVATKLETVVPGSGVEPAWQPVNPEAPAPPSSSPSTSASTSPSTSATPPSNSPSTTPTSVPTSPPSSTPPPPPARPGVQRIPGSDRFDTGVKISRTVWADANDGSAPSALRANAVVLATGASFPDALAGGPLAAAVGGPLLLTAPSALPDETLKEIQRVLPAFSGKTIYILGKYGAVNQRIESELNGLGYDTLRLGGDDRYETSRIIADEFARHVTRPAGSAMPIVLATGTTYADALPAGPLATLIGAPIVLTDGAAMDAATRDYIGARPVLPVGGPAYKAAGFAPKSDGDPCDDLAGADRYSTSAYVANCVAEVRGLSNLGPSGVMGVATGLNYPDALTGGALMGLMGDPLLLTDPNSLSPQAAGVLERARQSLQLVDLFGGTGALAPRVELQVVNAVGGLDLKPLVLGQTLPVGAAQGAVASAVVEGRAHEVSSPSRASVTPAVKPLAR